ncbi:MAG: class I SAM-dependent methyltransferase [Hyphomicrobiaceae bacterium]
MSKNAATTGNNVDTSLAHLALHRHTLELAGRHWQIDAVANQEALLAASDHFTAFPYGLLLWDAALALGAELAGMGTLPGKRILELGAGVGLVGLVASHLGASVFQTDHAAEALELSHHNAVLNGLTGIQLAPADWSNWTSTPVTGLFDIIVGSDILYDGSAHGPIAKVLDASLADDGMVILTDPKRTATPLFMSGMRKIGWQVEERERHVAALVPTWPGQTLPISVIQLKRPKKTSDTAEKPISE